MATSDVELTVSVNPSTDDPNGHYWVGSDISGEVVFRGTPTQPEYSRIIVNLIGKAEVYIYAASSDDVAGSDSNRQHYQESDVFYQHQLTLWESSASTSGHGNKSTTSSSLPTEGTLKFPFTFSLTPHIGKPLPASMECRDGKIKYTVTAKLIRNDEIEAAVAFTKIPVKVKVDINREDLIVPRATQNEVAVSQFCICQGELCFTTSIPRSGYCTGMDRICMVLKVDSNNANKLTSITSNLVKRTACYAESYPSINDTVLVSKQNTRLPRGGVSFSWNVPPINVPKTDCSLTNCSIIKIHYFIRTTFTGWCMNTHHIDLPLIIGNLPYRQQQTGEQSLEPIPQLASSSSLSDYRPTLPDSALHYEAPFVPSLSKHQSDPNDDETDREDQKLLK